MYARFGKRALDVVGAAALLAVLAPLLLGLAGVVRAALGAPVLFRQVRAGRDGVPFAVLKFRTLREGTGDDAARMTRTGRVLRALALDELPQLVNVLRGEMSLVGPRPLPTDYVALFTPRQALRLRVRPGLAGLAQAAGRNAVGWERRLELDAAYAGAPPRCARDIGLLLRCGVLALTGQGAAAPGHATMPAFRGEIRSNRGENRS